MVSALAIADLDELRNAGLTPTYDDVIRLNDLALRITDGPSSTAAHFPRFAVVGSVTFWEPTCAAWEWWSYAKTLAKDEQTEQRMFAFACAYGRRPRYLERLRDRDEINLALGKFLSSVTDTWERVIRAVRYCLNGYDDAIPEKNEREKKAEEGKSEGQIEAERMSKIEECLRDAAASTGLSMNDLLAQTPSRLYGMIRSAHLKAGDQITRNDTKLYGQYLVTLHAIRQRLEGERNATGTDNGKQEH